MLGVWVGVRLGEGGGSVLHGNQPLSKPRFWNPCDLCVVSVKVGDR